MHEYLQRYAAKWDLHRRIEFETYVEEISRTESGDGWSIRIKRADGSQDDYQTKKLIVATGITNRPHHPQLPDTSSYGCPIVHSSSLGKQADHLRESLVRAIVSALYATPEPLQNDLQKLCAWPLLTTAIYSIGLGVCHPCQPPILPLSEALLSHAQVHLRPMDA